MAKVQKKDPDVKEYSISDEDKQTIKRIITTMGFFNAALEGLSYSLQVQQAAIEKKCAIGEPPAGYKYQTRIDPATFKLFRRKVKIEDKKDAPATEK